MLKKDKKVEFKFVRLFRNCKSSKQKYTMNYLPKYYSLNPYELNSNEQRLRLKTAYQKVSNWEKVSLLIINLK